MTMVFIAVSAICYLAATAVVVSRIFHHQGPKHKAVLPLTAIALIGHGFVLANEVILATDHNMSMTNVASLIAWIICVAITLASFSTASLLLLPVVNVFAALTLGLAALVPATYQMQFDLRPGLVVHIGLALVAYGCLVIAMLYAFQLNYINNRLKQKQASILHSSLPPLMAVEHTLFRLLLTGTLLLVLSLGSGFLFLDDMFAQGQAHKTVLSVLAFVVFAAVVAGHHLWGWRGRPVLAGTVAGTLLLTLAYFGSRIVKEVILA